MQFHIYCEFISSFLCLQIVKKQMKTKIQILKESISLIFISFFVSGIYSLITKNIPLNTILNSILGLILCILLSSFIMYKIFENEKDRTLSIIKYSLIIIFSGIFSAIILILAITIFGEFLFNQLIEIVANQFKSSLINALFLFIPMLIVGLLFGIFGLMGIMMISFIIGNLIFSFVVEKFFSE